MKRCLIISPHFPPSTLAGVHRARHLAKHLPHHGWDPEVICIDPKQHVEMLDPELARLVPDSVRIVQAGALPIALTRPFGLVGEIGLRGFFHLRASIARSINDTRPDAILITGSPFYPMLLAGWIKRTWGIPVVLDFQDPWVSNEGASRTRWSKGWFSYRLAVALEPLAVRGASWITSVSDRQNSEMASRYPDLDSSRMSAIVIGGDPTDFGFLRDRAEISDGSHNFTFSYVGTALPRSTPLLAALFAGVAELRRRDPEFANRLKFRFVGTSNQPGGGQDYRVKPLAEAAGVADLVFEEPGRVPYLDALSILATTDATMMIGSDEPHYTASKIYPFLMAARPFISIFHRESSAHSTLAKAGGGIALAFEDKRELDVLALSVAQAIKTIVSDEASLGKIDPTSYDEFTARAIAGRYAEIFELISGASASSSAR